jgi:hypothetical protein
MKESIFYGGTVSADNTPYSHLLAMLRSAGARRLRKTLRRCPAGAKKIAQRIASWTWDVTHERALSPADLFGGKAPVGALIGLLERIR